MMICSQRAVTMQCRSSYGLFGLMVFLLLMTTGCNTVPEEKRDDLIGTLQQLESGVHEERLQQSEQQLDKLKRNQQAQQEKLASVQRQRASRQARVQRLSQQARAQQARKAQAAEKVRSLQEQRRIIRQHMQALEREMALLDQQLAKQDHASDQNIDELIRQRDTLRKQLSQLIGQSL